MKSHYRILLLVAGCLAAAACKKHDPCMAEAVLTGYDLRLCACCGGLMMNPGNDTRLYANDYLFVDKLPDDFRMDSTMTFPIYIRADWKRSQNPPCGDTARHITVTRIELR